MVERVAIIQPISIHFAQNCIALHRWEIVKVLNIVLLKMSATPIAASAIVLLSH